MDRIDLVDLKLDCILGVLDHEQRMAQPLVGQVSLWLDLERSGDENALEESVNYADVAARLSFIARNGRFRLLEAMSLTMLRAILLSPAPTEGRAAVQKMSLTLRKPTILGELATPGTHFERDASWASAVKVVDLGAGVSAEVLIDNGRERALRVRLGPGASWNMPEDHACMVIAGSIATGEFTVGAGVSLPAGEIDDIFADDGANLLIVKVPVHQFEDGGH